MRGIKLDLSPLFEKIEEKVLDQVKSVYVPMIIPALTAELGEEVDKFIYQVQEKIVKPRTPSRTGKLRASILLVVDHRNTKSLVIRCYAGYPSNRGVPYAAAIEFGRTGGKEIEPRKAKAIAFVGNKRVPRKKWGHYATVRYAPRATENVVRLSITQGPISKVEMFQAGLDFIYQNIATVLKHKMNTIDYTKFRFKPGGRGFSLRGTSPQVMRSTHTPTGGTSVGSMRMSEDIDIKFDTNNLDTIKESDFN